MAFLIKTIQFLAGLSIIVGIHELGHLLFAKLFGMRVNSYMIGFPPKIFKIKFGETEYALGSIPLGGAVQIAGMIDESLDSNHLTNPPQPWEFRSKSAWQRLMVILGGIVFNLISGTLIYIGLVYMRGSTYLPKDEVNKYGIIPNTIGMQMGFKEGDKIIKINGKDFEDFNDALSPTLLLREKSYYTIIRDDRELNLSIPEKIIEYLSDNYKTPFIQPIYPCVIRTVVPNSNAYLAGLMEKDQIITLAGKATLHIDQLITVAKTCLGKEVEIVYLRNGIQMATTIKIEQQGLGIVLAQPAYKALKYSFLQSIPIGVKKATTTIQNQCLAIWKLLTGKLSITKSLGGPISIVQIFSNEFIWDRFLELVALLSIVIGLTNLLPLPVLDGGHALFILYEMLSGRKPSDRFLKITQKWGMVILLLIMLYAFGNDIRKLLTAAFMYFATYKS
ncbi:RIP metalloprotease RseP [Candidatus Cardinium hertigii]|uniref:Zinc metalloprotease n=1 Tax=Candidatus Cardinium hertigii TaxID=247481 RepID=A0A3N2QD29_9BACT|nr:RIP metalloprotease RseP [Candidatus Cardinium hertigii]ROT47700.1 RIP metalloprotease RseP [Candidatus Cardinium hertigii]